MAITTSAGDGVRVTSPAWCGVANSGTTTTAVLNGRWALGANQNNGNTCACFTMPCRVVVLRQGACNQEIRFITAACECAGADTTTITVHEPWCTTPTACDSVDISYIIQDAATLTGLSLLSKRVQDFGSTRSFNVGNAGCAPAYALFAMVNGVSLESCGSAMANCVPDVEVENNGHFINGYVSNGVGINGGYFVFANQTAGRCGFRANNGAIVDILDNQEWNSVSNPEHRILGACTSGTIRLKDVFGTREFDLSASGITYEDWRMQGQGVACDVINVAGGVTINNFELINMGAIRNINQNTCAETMTFKNVVFAGNPGDIITVQGACSNNKTFILQNPKYTNCPPTCDITLLGAASSVQEQFIQTVTVQNPDGTKINNSVLNHISTRCATAAIRVTTTSNSCGIATLNTEQRRWTGVCETLATSTAHGLQVHNYSCESFATLPSLTNKTGGFGQCLTVAVCNDSYVVEATEATALSDGSTKITICGPVATPHSIIKFTGGSGTLTVGQVVGVCNGTCAPTVYGTVKELSEGNSTAGTIVLTARTGSTFSGTLQEYCSGCLATKLDWTGTFTTSSQTCYTWLMCAGQIGCTNRTMQQLYDSNKAKLHECPIDTADNWDDVKVWGESEHPHPIRGVSGAGTGCVKFRTVRNVANTEGWVVTGLLNLGQVDRFTSDNGTAFVPQQSFNITAKVTDSVSQNNVRCAGVWIEEVPTALPVIGQGTTNTCGEFTASYTGPSCQAAEIVVRKRGYVPVRVNITINSNVTVPISLTQCSSGDTL